MVGTDDNNADLRRLKYCFQQNERKQIETRA
jgi:hypothetical protein